MSDIVYAKKWLARAQTDYDFAAKIEKHFHYLTKAEEESNPSHN